ncbi:hypothetical protein FIBSPDRAFT_816407 [Athelia psychrophila]|uniref:FAD-binding FR-type domain-containing protein n=1 Tax=Athelia psychrophila TaxID=1759441 RepID=A0A166S695_9AGAM|nr:hypothetical protein FIBSPDRAFT_816407 [Fibularhizoctonia sp. CBS 109695]
MMTAIEPALKGWHPGEQAVQALMNLPARVSITAVVNALPEQHQIFHSYRLQFIPVTTLDPLGRPWASILAPRDGGDRFIECQGQSSLTIHANVWDRDPILCNMSRYKSRVGLASGAPLLSAVGLEPSTRRRNKFAGIVSDVVLEGTALSLKVDITQALGLCPKYISVRTLVPYPSTTPRVVHHIFNMGDAERLPMEVIDFVHSADTAYLATSYVAVPRDKENFPSHVSTNHRGGRAGFVRVRPCDERTLVLPNYSGNRLMNSLGNIHITPLAGLVFPSFDDGSILYVTGQAKTLYGPEAEAIMPSIGVITTIRVTGYTLVRNALPLRHASTCTVERSPYSPPVRYLAEETSPTESFEDVSLSFVKAQVHSDNLATYTIRASRSVISVKPGGNVVLDLSEFLRLKSHQLVEWQEGPHTRNDDCVRTWTVSIPPTTSDPCSFAITVRNVKGGLITPILHNVFSNAIGAKPTVQDISHLEISAKLRGIGGELPVPEPIAVCDGGRRLLWVAGGIGITPFLALTRHISALVKQTYGLWDIVLVVSAREPDIILDLINDSLSPLGTDMPIDLRFTIHLFSSVPFALKKAAVPRFVDLEVHVGQVPNDGKLFQDIGSATREPHICGPLPFVLNCMAGMGNAGVKPEDIKRERFTY